MDEVIVTGHGETSPEESSAHEAAVAEGAAAVHHDAAEDAAAEAKAAAEASLATAAANVAAAEAAAESADRAEAAAEQSGVTLEAIHSALVGQGEAINTFIEEIRASRQEVKPEPKPEPVEHKSDEAPKTPGKPKRRGFIVR